MARCAGTPRCRPGARSRRAQRGARARTPPATIGRRRSHSALTRQGSRSLAPPASFSPRLARKAGNVELEQRTPRFTATRDPVPPHVGSRGPMRSEADSPGPGAGRGQPQLGEPGPAAGSRSDSGERCPQARGAHSPLSSGGSPS